ncbi:daptide biosynthesis RiPP recognition protein [Microbacterium sp. NPDC090218]
MRGGGGAAGRELIGARALREWISGEQDEYSRVFLVERGATAAGIDEAARQGDVVLVPEEGGSYAGPADSVRYRGALCEVGDELFFGERGIELQDYVAAAFVQIIGPTAVCLLDSSSREAFLEDAELARRTGVFPSALIDPRVVLANRSALVNPDELGVPRAIRVSADGRVSVGLHGEVIGTVDDLPAVLEGLLPRAAALGGRPQRDALAADLRRREWMGRYLNATDLLKMLRRGNGTAKISGFGWLLIEDDLADAEPLTADPFLLDTEDGFVLADTRTLRRQLLSPATAVVVAAMQTSSALEVAAERVARHLGIPAREASAPCLEAVTALNITLGQRPDASLRSKDAER